MSGDTTSVLDNPYNMNVAAHRENVAVRNNRREKAVEEIDDVVGPIARIKQVRM